jgi:hypothetical protein
MKTFKVVELDVAGQMGAVHIVQASTPEAAAATSLGLDVVRGSSKSARPVVKVYWDDGQQQTNMVRLYARLGQPSQRFETQASGSDA